MIPPCKAIVAVPVTMLLALAIEASAQDQSAVIRRGEMLVTARCAMCHSVGRTGTSPNPTALPFRTVYRRNSVQSLAESLGEGLTSGHPEMPAFAFSPRDVHAILSYLDSIQER